MKIGFMALLLAVGVAQSRAQSNWVQTATFALRAYGVGSTPLSFNNSSIIGYLLNGATSTNVPGTLVTNYSTTTNTAVTASSGVAEIDDTNDPNLNLSTNSYWFTTNLVSGGTNLVFTNFPAIILATNIGSYVTNSVTNSVTNVVTLTLTSNAPPTYVFTNTVAVGTNSDFVFTNLFSVITNSTASSVAAPCITAVLTTNANPSNLVFSLEYSLLLTNITTNTTTSTGSNAVIGALYPSPARLLFFTPLGGGAVTNGTFVTPPASGAVTNGMFVIQQGSGQNLTNTVLAKFIQLSIDPDVVPAVEGTTTYGLLRLRIEALSSDAGYDADISLDVFYKSGSKTTNLRGQGTRTVLGSVSGTVVGHGILTTSSTVQSGGTPVVFEGTLNISGGTAE